MRDAGAITFDLGAIQFDGFDEGFAAQACAALEAGLSSGLADSSLQEALADRRDVVVDQLSLDGLDFSTADRLGQSLAQAILRGVVQR